jgi:hypothetical protein
MMIARRRRGRRRSCWLSRPLTSLWQLVPEPLYARRLLPGNFVFPPGNIFDSLDLLAPCCIRFSRHPDPTRRSRLPGRESFHLDTGPQSEFHCRHPLVCTLPLRYPDPGHRDHKRNVADGGTCNSICRRHNRGIASLSVAASLATRLTGLPFGKNSATPP